MGSSKSGRVESHLKVQAFVEQRFQVERLQMEQNRPDWVFKVQVSPRFTYPLREYVLRLNGSISPERLFQILKGVEEELADALHK